MTGNYLFDHWTVELRGVLDVLLGAQPTAELAARWSAHASDPAIVTTIFGQYDSGKSALLKRLLVEHDTAVPDWVQVGGRPTTFAAQSVECQGVRFVDTPGIGTDMDRHTAEALRAAELTDALLLVLPPQLLTSDAEQVLAVLDGTTSRSIPFPDHAIIAVVARADQIFGDPQDEPGVFRRSQQRKRDELRQQLGRARTRLPAIDIHVVVADAGASVGDRRVTSADAYRRGPWDGIGELAAALRELPQRQAELRRQAGIRYWSHVGHDTERATGERLAELRRIIDEAQRRNAELDGHVADLEKLDEAQRLLLRETILAELNSIVHTLLVRPTGDVPDRIGHSLQGPLASWHAAATSALRELAEEARVQLVRRATRTSARELSEVVGSLTDDDGPPASTDSTFRTFVTFLPTTVEYYVNQHYERFIGVALGDARKEVELFRRLADNDKLADYLAVGKFISTEHAEAAADLLKRADGLIAAVPVVTKMAKFYLDERDEQKREAQNHDRLEQLSDRLDSAADQVARFVITGDGEHGWAQEVQFLRNRLDQLRATALIAQLERQAAAMEGTLATLQSLLDEPPSFG